MSGAVLGREHWYAALARRWNRAWSDPDDRPPTIYLRAASGSGLWVVVEPGRGIDSMRFVDAAAAWDHARVIQRAHGWPIADEQHEELVKCPS